MSLNDPAPIENYSQLGKMLGVARQSARALARHELWPFDNPPWPGYLRDRILAHHADRRAWSPAYGDRPPEHGGGQGDAGVIQAHHFGDETCPLCLRDWLGDDLDSIPRATLERLAARLDRVMGDAAFERLSNEDGVELLNMLVVDTLAPVLDPEGWAKAKAEAGE